MIFVDTSGWYARYVPSDPQHVAVRAFHLANREPLVTTDYVVDETLTLLKSRGNAPRAFRLGRNLWNGRLANLIYVTAAEISDAWHLFDSYRDKDWSFTDCTSHVVMKRLRISKALTLDAHFRQFGFVTVLP